MINPLRSEREAFQFLLYAAGMMAVIVVARPDRPGDLLSADLALAERVAREAGALLLERFGGPARGVGSKSSATDLVSDADRDAERLIRDVLAHERPDDALLAEEGTSESGESGRRWVFDPLDGTVSYLYGYPHWSVSVALEDAGGGAAGVVYDPNRDELFAAERGGGATLGGQAIGVREAPPLAEALVATGFGYDADWRARAGRGRRAPAARGPRHPPRRLGGARPGVACGRAARRLLRARPERVGLGRGQPARARGRRRRRGAGRRAIRPDRGAAGARDGAAPARRGLMEVAVVGGGIVGVAAAAFLAEAGAKVTLAEQAEIGAGASGRNSGAVQHPFDPGADGPARGDRRDLPRARRAGHRGLPARPAA